MMRASLVEARSTSDCVISPVAVERCLRITFSWGSSLRDPLTASREPEAPALRMAFRIFTSPSEPSNPSKELALKKLPLLCSLSLALRSLSRAFSAISLAFCSSPTTWKASPALGTLLSPVICTANEGWTSDLCSPEASTMDLTLPYPVPAATTSPTLRLPACTMQEATGPQVLSMWASKIVPLAGTFCTPLYSYTSDSSTMESSRLSTPSPVLELIGTTTVSPPHSSGRRLT
mmetsp:Transcript_6714/g.19663  ORF Transcript_6714/g.19663 Transcript_6714/m.19663 type:complete len:233 (-) Transcript_6714:667-1365(-)